VLSVSQRSVLDGPLEQPEGSAPAATGAPSKSVRAALSRLTRQVWFWPTTLALLAGVAKIWNPELWRDELRSWSAASRSLEDLFHLLGNTDAAVALYYLVLHGWVAVFGESAVSMRLPSTLAMAGATAIVCLIAARLFNRRTAVVAGLIFAIIPAISRFAQEVRPYAITMLVACLATLLLLRAIERPGWGRFLAYGVSITVLCLTQIVAAPLLAAHALGILLWHRRDRGVWLRAGVSIVVGLALASPIVLLSQAQYGHQVGSLPDATFQELTLLPPRLFASSLVAGAVAILGVLAFTGPLRAKFFLAGWALIPIAAIWIASNLGQSYWMSRYMLFTLPAFAILAAVTIAALNTRLLVVVMLVVAAMGAQDQREIRWIGSHDQWVYPAYANTAVLYSQAAQILRDNMRPGDAIAYAGRADYWLIDIGLAYHLKGQEMPRDIFVQQSALERGDFWPVECPDPAACLADANPDRIWVISIGLLTDDPLEVMRDFEPDKARALARSYRTVDEWFPSGLDLTLMERR
jgi:mannosyltransferase